MNAEVIKKLATGSLEDMILSHPLLNFLSLLQIASDGNWRCSLNGEDENLASFRKILQLGTQTN